MKTLNDQYYTLRLALESAAATPAVFVVGAATEHDGSAGVACSLARAFAEAGYKTVIVDACGGAVFQSEYGVKIAAAPDLSMMPAAATNGAIKNLAAVAVSGCAVRVSTSYQKMRMAIAELRHRFEIVVVNAGALPSHPEAMQFASAGDGVILAFRFGRKPERADREITGMLERIGTNVLGVVAIGDENDRRPEPAFHAPVEEAPAQAVPRFRAFAANAPAAVPMVPAVAAKEAV